MSDTDETAEAEQASGPRRWVPVAFEFCAAHQKVHPAGSAGCAGGGCDLRHLGYFTAPDHTLREWRVVNDTGGIMFAVGHDEPGVWPDQRAEEWRARLEGYGHQVHVEVWEQSWNSTDSTWRRVDQPGPQPDPGS